MLLIKVFRIGQFTGHLSAFLGLKYTADIGPIAINEVFLIGQVTGHRSALLGPTQVTSDLLLSIKVFRIGRVTSHRSSLLGANTADIGPIAINQVISYWPSNRSSVSLIGGQYS